MVAVPRSGIRFTLEKLHIPSPDLTAQRTILSQKKPKMITERKTCSRSDIDLSVHLLSAFHWIELAVYKHVLSRAIAAPIMPEVSI